MKEKLEKFFVSKYTFIYACFIAACVWLTWLTCCLVRDFNYELAVDGLIYIGLIVGLLAAYKYNETNIQKALLGALLVYIVNSSVKMFWTYLKLQATTTCAFFGVLTICSVIVFVGHLLQQSDHAGTNAFLFINQCCFVVMCLSVCFAIKQAFFAQTFQVLDVTFIMAWVFTYLIVICIETRIQKYKSLRLEAKAQGKWNDEVRAKAKQLFSTNVDEE